VSTTTSNSSFRFPPDLRRHLTGIDFNNGAYIIGIFGGETSNIFAMSFYCMNTFKRFVSPSNPAIDDADVTFIGDSISCLQVLERRIF
jgi:hypothetical protein